MVCDIFVRAQWKYIEFSSIFPLILWKFYSYHHQKKKLHAAARDKMLCSVGMPVLLESIYFVRLSLNWEKCAEKNYSVELSLLSQSQLYRDGVCLCVAVCACTCVHACAHACTDYESPKMVCVTLSQ